MWYKPNYSSFTTISKLLREMKLIGNMKVINKPCDVTLFMSVVKALETVRSICLQERKCRNRFNFQF